MKTIIPLVSRLIANGLLTAAIGCGGSGNITPYIEVVDRRPEYLSVDIYGNYRDIFFRAKNGNCGLRSYAVNNADSFVDYGCNGTVDEMRINGDTPLYRTAGTEGLFQDADARYKSYLKEIQMQIGLDLTDIVRFD